MKHYEISDQDIQAVVRYLEINDPENATTQNAIAFLEDMHAMVHNLAHTNPEKLIELKKALKRQDG